MHGYTCKFTNILVHPDIRNQSREVCAPIQCPPVAECKLMHYCLFALFEASFLIILHTVLYKLYKCCMVLALLCNASSRCDTCYPEQKVNSVFCIRGSQYSPLRATLVVFTKFLFYYNPKRIQCYFSEIIPRGWCLTRRTGNAEKRMHG